MSKLEKALEKLKATPTPASIKWTELRSILAHLEYELINGGGARRNFCTRSENF